MQRYRITPQFKKSVVETEVYSKKGIDGKYIYAGKELGWRTGEFIITVPETDEEITQWVETMNNNGCHWTRPQVTQMLLDGLNPFLPSEDDTFVELDDYDYEMESTWDGCWEDWNIEGINDDAKCELLIEQITEGYNESYEDWMEENDWEFVSHTTELHCNPYIEEIVE
tara:strand:- start:19 stop:525 length:507 start_codon:yes stop_codon:yes gene_type:complete